MQTPESHLQQPPGRRGVSPEAVQRILAARHAFVQQQRRQDRAVAGSAGKRFDPASVSAVLCQSLVRCSVPCWQVNLEATIFLMLRRAEATLRLGKYVLHLATLPAGSGAPR